MLRTAAADFYQLRWSKEILDEMERNLVSTGIVTDDKAARLRATMERFFPEAMVTGYEPLIAAMQNDMKDRHVVAAAGRPERRSSSPRTSRTSRHCLTVSRRRLRHSTSGAENRGCEARSSASADREGTMNPAVNVSERVARSDRLLNKWAVEERTSLDITTIYRKMKAGTFPQPVRVGRRRVAWRESDIAAWQAGLEVGTRL